MTTIQSGNVEYNVSFEFLPMKHQLVYPKTPEDYYFLEAWLSCEDLWYDHETIIALHGISDCEISNQNQWKMQGTTDQTIQLKSYIDTLDFLKRSVPAFADMHNIIWKNNQMKNKEKIQRLLTNPNRTNQEETYCKQQSEYFSGLEAIITIKVKFYPQKQISKRPFENNDEDDS